MGVAHGGLRGGNSGGHNLTFPLWEFRAEPGGALDRLGGTLGRGSSAHCPVLSQAEASIARRMEGSQAHEGFDVISKPLAHSVLHG